jgi:hypothetical protein
MTDVVYIAVAVAFGLLSVGLVILCARLQEGRR